MDRGINTDKGKDTYRRTRSWTWVWTWTWTWTSQPSMDNYIGTRFRDTEFRHNFQQIGKTEKLACCWSWPIDILLVSSGGWSNSEKRQKTVSFYHYVNQLYTLADANF